MRLSRVAQDGREIPPADLRRPALGHIDSLLATFRPVRRNQPETRAWWRALLERLESFRALCEAWDGTRAPPMRLQEAARAVLMHLNHKSSSEEYEALDEEVSPFTSSLPARGARRLYEPALRGRVPARLGPAPACGDDAWRARATEKRPACPRHRRSAAACALRSMNKVALVAKTLELDALSRA